MSGNVQDIEANQNAFSFMKTAHSAFSYLEGKVKNGIENHAILTSIFSVVSGFFGMRNITNAYSITSVTVGVFFAIPSYIFFNNVLSDIPKFKDNVLRSIQTNKVAQIGLEIIRRFGREVKELAEKGSSGFPVVTAALFAGVFVYCITDIGIKTIAILAVTGFALLNVDRAKIYEGFKESAQAAISNMRGVHQAEDSDSDNDFEEIPAGS